MATTMVSRFESAQVSAWMAVGPPTRAVPPPGGRRLAGHLAQLAHLLQGLLGVRVALEDDLEAQELAVVGGAGREGGGDAGRLVQRAGDHAGDELGRRLRRLDQHRGRRQRALGEVLLEERVALLGRHVLEEVLGEAEARAVEEAAERQHDEDGRDDGGGTFRGRGHALGDATPRPVFGRVAFARDPRPERPPPEHREKGRHEGEAGDQRHEHAEPQHRRERAVVAVVREEQRQDGQRDGEAARGDGLPGLAQRRGRGRRGRRSHGAAPPGSARSAAGRSRYRRRRAGSPSARWPGRRASGRSPCATSARMPPATK